MSTRPVFERRKYKRHAMKEGVFLVFRPLFDVLGHVTNACKGGVAFEYCHYHAYPKSKPISVDIFSGKTTQQLSRVRCRIVFDERKPDPASVLEIRRCGLQFSCLSERQAATLDYFLRRFCQPGASKENEEAVLVEAP